MPDIPYNVDDARTDATAVSFKWRVVAPTDVTPAPTADFPNGIYPSGTASIAASANPRRATFMVTTLPNTAVTTDRYFDVEIYEVLPVGSTLTVGKVRTKLTEDDAATPPTNGIVYGPSTTGDTGLRAVGSTNMRMEHPYKNQTVAGTYMLGLDANGNGVALHQGSDTSYQLRRVTAGSIGNPLDGGDPSILGGSSLATTFTDGDILAVEFVNGRVSLKRNEQIVSSAAYPYNASEIATGTNARYVRYAGAATLANLKITRL